MDTGTKALFGTIVAAVIGALATLGAQYMNLIKPSEKQVVESRIFISQATEAKLVEEKLAKQIEYAGQLEKRIRELEDQKSDPTMNTTGRSGCPDSMKTARPVPAGSTSGTTEAVFELPSSPCPREITIVLEGSATATANVGVRSVEWVLLDGEKELCRAAGSLRPEYPSGRVYGAKAQCTLLLSAGEPQRIRAKLASASNSESTSVRLTLLSAIK